MKFMTCIFVIFILGLCFACSLKDPETKIQELVNRHNEKTITNYQMLLEMGMVYLSHPENLMVRKEYFNRMIISGYSSWVLHHYLACPGKIETGEDRSIIMNAIRSGKHYDLARSFIPYFDEQESERLNYLVAAGDSLEYYNNHILNDAVAGSLAGRGGFFTSLGENEMAAYDLNRSLRMDPCGSKALFRRALMLFQNENTREVIRLLESCSKEYDHNREHWQEVFYQLAKNIESLNQSVISNNDKLFRLANLYLDNGFEQLALAKSSELVKNYGENPDYLALHAFVYYRIGDRSSALKYINEAESISGRDSRLRSLIEQM